MTRYSGHLRDEAYRWFFGSNSDFEAWCEDAGMEPEYVRRKARHIYDNGLPEWRAKAGQGKRFEERRKYRERLKAMREETRP